MKTKTISAIATVVLSINCLLAGNPLLPFEDNDRLKGNENIFKAEFITSNLRNKYRGEAPQQVIKLNITQLAITNLSFQYEYGFHQNMSAAVGMSYLLPRAIPGFFLPDSTANTVNRILSPEFSGFGITPEFRFYPGKKENNKAPHGFYLAAYIRYSNYKVSASYVEKFSKNLSTFHLNASYRGFTGGMMIGSQWLIGKHFSIDWWIAGAGFGKSKLAIDAFDGAANLSPEDQIQLKNGLTNYLAGLNFIGADNPLVSTTSKSFVAQVTGMRMFSYRAGLCLGFAF